MSKLLIVIPFNAEETAIAERLLDWIYQLNGRQAKGHVLLFAAADVHQEFKIKIRISADLAFEGVTEATSVGVNWPMPPGKIQLSNNLFRQASTFVQRHYRWPWLYMEACCVPLKADWMQVIADAYDNQPRRYFGPRMKSGEKLGDKMFMARTAVYPQLASSELDGFCDDITPFELVSANHVIPRSTRVDGSLIQMMNFHTKEDLDKVRNDSVLLNGDRTGMVIENLRDRLPMSEGEQIKWFDSLPKNGAVPKEALTLEAVEKACHALENNPTVYPLPLKQDAVLTDNMLGSSKPLRFQCEKNGELERIDTEFMDGNTGAPNPAYQTPAAKIDKRTKAYRALKARQKAQ